MNAKQRDAVKGLMKFVPQTAKAKGRLPLPFYLFGGAVALVGAAYSSLYNVEGGHAAIKFNKIVGVREQVYEEGTHLKIPFFEEPIIFSMRPRIAEIPTLTGSKDLQTVNITLRVLSKPDITKLPTVFRTLGTDWDGKVLPSIVNEVSKGVVAQFNAAQLITQRELVSSLVEKRLSERAANFNIILDNVAITHLGFSREYDQAVEAKQIAQQEAERARFVVEKAQQEKQALIARAAGEAKSAELIGEAIATNPNFLRLRKIEAARDIAQTVAHSNNKVYLDADVLLLNTMGSDGDQK